MELDITSIKEKKKVVADIQAKATKIIERERTLREKVNSSYLVDVWRWLYNREWAGQ